MRAISCFFALSLIFGNIVADEAEVYQTVKAIVDKAMNRQQIPGAAIAVVHQGKSYLFNFGHSNFATKDPMLSDTIFKIASITKVFTSTALSVEVLSKKISLDDPISLYFPYLINSKNAKIRVLDLATHSSGLPRTYPSNNRENATMDELYRYLFNWQVRTTPGNRYVYSNLGFGLLGEIIARVNKTSYEKAIDTLVLSPLQMSSTFVNVPLEKKEKMSKGYSLLGHALKSSTEKSLLQGGGALYSTATDMLKFLQANMGLKGPESLVNAMKYAQKEYFQVNSELSLGLGWQRFSTKNNTLIIDKNGNLPGFSSYIGFIPAKDIGIVILFNKSKSHATVVGRHLLLKLEDESDALQP